MQNEVHLKQEKLPCDEKHDVLINYFLNSNNIHLFNEPAYFKIHSRSSNDCYAQLVRRSDGAVFGTLSLYEVEAAVYVSPARGTFGGVSCSATLDLKAFEAFIKTVSDYLRRQGGREIRIRLSPAAHDISLFAITFNCLLREGYQADRTELNYEITLNDTSFLDRIAHGNRKRIQKTLREGFFCNHESFASLPKIHQLIAENRLRLGVPMSMSVDQLNHMAMVFPERLHLFAVYRDSILKEMVAAAVCLEISQDILYVFYWGDIDGMRNYSPIALLASYIYEFGVSRGMTVLDVGTSTVNGEPNHGLVTFKRNLGFRESLKVELVWLSA